MDCFDFVQKGTADAIMSYAKADKIYIRTESLDRERLDRNVQFGVRFSSGASC
jgi:hypothetical protein